MYKPLLVRLTGKAQTRSPFNVVVLRAFCVVRQAQRRVSQAPSHVRSVAKDVANAWRESGHIVPNE